MIFFRFLFVILIFFLVSHQALKNSKTVLINLIYKTHNQINIIKIWVLWGWSSHCISAIRLMSFDYPKFTQSLDLLPFPVQRRDVFVSLKNAQSDGMFAKTIVKHIIENAEKSRICQGIWSLFQSMLKCETKLQQHGVIS